MALKWLAWRRHAKARPRTDRGTADRTPRLQLECLEDRAVPATFFVNTTLDDVTPANGKQSLREAITRANTNPGADIIVVPAGVFKMTVAGAFENSNATGDFDVTGTLTIQGAGAGITAIDGQQLDRVFDILGTAPSSIKLVLQGLTVRNGSLAGDGGGIRSTNADLVVRDSIVSGNRASLTGGGISNNLVPGTGNVTIVRSRVSRNVAGDGGGGVYVEGNSSLTVKDSTVRRNLAGNNGGGIFADTATLTNSTVNGNTAVGGVGGGIIVIGTATLSNCTVNGNSAGGLGGGIEAGAVTLSNSTISGNTAAGTGGGILATTATLTNCTLSGNSAVGGGGGFVGTTATLSGCTVSGNTTGGNGGGISATTANLTNSTVSGNTAAGNGGGIFAKSAALLNVTIAENSAHTGGGLFHDPGGTFSVKNTIVALNLVDFTGTGPDVSGAFTSQGHNLIGGGGGGFTNGVNGDIVGTSANPIDPKLGALANNGGKTKTHALLAGSPAIDHGDNTGVPATDQRGLPRKKDGNGDGSARVDIGAFER